MENIALLKERWFKKEVERLANEGVSKADISRALGIKPQYLNSILNGSRGLADAFLDNFIKAYNIKQFDLLPPVTDANTSAMSLRLMEKLDEKDAKIDHLQSELLSAKEELAALKAKYQDKESGFKFPNITEDFTSESSGDYGEDYSPTKPHTTSKRSSVGKI